LSAPEWIFANEQGNWFDASNLREREFDQCLKKAGLHGRRLHDLRHTYASLLLTDGAPMSYVSEQMGHQSIELMVKRYGHLIPGKIGTSSMPCPVVRLPRPSSMAENPHPSRTLRESLKKKPGEIAGLSF